MPHTKNDASMPSEAIIIIAKIQYGLVSIFFKEFFDNMDYCCLDFLVEIIGISQYHNSLAYQNRNCT